MPVYRLESDEKAPTPVTLCLELLDSGEAMVAIIDGDGVLQKKDYLVAFQLDGRITRCSHGDPRTYCHLRNLGFELDEEGRIQDADWLDEEGRIQDADCE